MDIGSTGFGSSPELRARRASNPGQCWSSGLLLRSLEFAPCPGNPGHGGVWTSVELLPGSEGGLYANYGGQKVLLAL